MNPRQLIRAIAAVAILAIPAAAFAEPDQNTNGNGPYYNNGQWNNGQNNGNWDGRHRHRDRDDGDRDDNGRHRGWYQGRGNPHGYFDGNGYNRGYGYGGYGNRNGQLGGMVSSFSPYNLYLNNGTHVVLHDGTVINPTGINLTGGQRVRVYGSWNQDGSFAANQIDVIANGYRY